MDIIDKVIYVFKKYECPDNVDCENKHAEFWIQCFDTGIAEIKSDLTEENIKKEFADMVFIGIDGLNKMGYDVRQVLNDRLEVNNKKDLRNRDIKFYKDKQKSLKDMNYELFIKKKGRL